MARRARRNRKQAAIGVASLRNTKGAMRDADWDKKYQEALRTGKGGNGAQQKGLF